MSRSFRWPRIVIPLALIGVVVALGYLLIPYSPLIRTERGGVYVEGVAGLPQTINPLFSQYNDVDRDLCALVFEGLTGVDDAGLIVPGLAESWSVSPDGLTYTFTLRQGVLWHDGAPFTADDVLFTVGVLGDPDFQLLDSSGVFDLWSRVAAKKLSDSEVEFTLSQPFAPFLHYTTTGILPAHLLSSVDVRLLRDAQFNGQPVGLGPFKVVDVNARRIELEANASYYGGRPLLDGMTFRFYSDDESLFSAYEKGEIVGISRVAPAFLPRVASHRDLNLYSARLAKYTMILFNLTDKELPFFQQAEVRQALLWGVNRTAIVDRLLAGQAIVANSPMLPDTWAYNPDLPHFAYSPDKARDLLTQAGWADLDGDGIRERDGRQLKFSLIVSDDPTWTRVVQEIARQWAEIGVAMTPETVTFPELVGDFLYPRRYEAILIAPEFAGDPDPYPFWHSSQAGPDGQNWAGFSHRRADEIMEEARVSGDVAQRTQLYREFQSLFSEQTPAILLYYPIYNYAIDAQVQGVQVAPMNNPGDRFRTASQWYIESKHLALPWQP